ncbi:MAG: ankyrin repeat domain-containing protein [Xanthomonadales bacterium]|nr:ankyrin repeat domain-containing protein [Xanthomonadales bacterium]MCP5473957.1 ankyrin repeat domain-containing protein [Rhodanobacteraceae bacterium]
MLDLTSLMAVAEVLKLVSGFPGDAQYVLRETVARCEGMPFVRVAQDLEIDGDLLLDWDAPPWTEVKACGLLVEGNLKVSGRISNLQLEAGPTLVVLGNVQADRIAHGGASWLIQGTVRVGRSFFGVYNDGYAFVGGDLLAEIVVNDDHHLEVAGTIQGRKIDRSSGHAWLIEGLIDEDGEVDFDAIWARDAQGLPILRTEPGTIDIHAAAEAFDSELLLLALARGANLELRDDFGNTPLLAAMAAGRMENARHLLRAGAIVDVVNDQGEGPAHLLGYARDPVILDEVLSAVSRLDALDRNGRSPMMRAIEREDLISVQALLAHGARLPAPDLQQDGYPYAMTLAESPQAELLAFLLDQGANLEWSSSDWLSEGHTLLHEAAWRGNLRSVRALLAAGFSVDARDAKGRTPLRLMLDLAPRILGDQPGQAAAMVQVLLDAGADPLARAADGKDALDAAAAMTDDEVLRTVYAAAVRGSLEPSRKVAIATRLQTQ